MICSWSNSYQSSYVVFSECFKRKECSRFFFQQPIYVKKFCKLYYLQYQTQKSIEYNFHIYILQFGPDCKMNASVWNIHHHKLSRVFLVDKNCACWQWPTYYEIKEGRRQRHKKDRFWVNGPLWRIVFQFFFFWSDQVWKMVINMFIGVVNMYSFIRKVMME